MQNLFTGYIPLKGKKPKKSFDDVHPLEEVQTEPEYGGRLHQNTILVDVDDYDQSERLMDLVEDLQLNCKVIQTDKGKHFYFYGYNVDTCKTGATLAVGIKADIKIGKVKAHGTLKYQGKLREVIYDIEPEEEYEPLPVFLTPVKSNIDFTAMGEGDGRNQSLFNYILTLQSALLSKDEIIQTINLLNKYVLPDPLEQSELDVILRDEAFKKVSFYSSSGKFLFDRFSEYMQKECNVIILEDNLHMYDNGIYVSGARAFERKMLQINKGLSARNRSEVLKYLINSCDVVKERAGAEYIAFNNGIYNINTGQLEDFRPDIIIKNKIPFNYNYDAYNETMDNVLDKISCHDDSIRDLLEEMAGYCLYRRNELRKAFILIGDKANGKSTYLDCIAYMIGEENTASLDLKELGDRFRTAALFNKLVNIGDDIGDEFIADPSIFKKLVSGDRVTAERKGEHPFEFSNYSKLLFSANNIPRIKDKTGAVLDRLVIIPFNASFSKQDPDYDPYIKYKLRSTEAMEYLIQLGLDGLKRVLDNNGFTICEKVQAELDEYNEQNNPVIGFLKEVDIEVDILNQPVKDVYIQYTLYCNSNGYTPVSNKVFGKQLRQEANLESKSIKITTGDKVTSQRVYRRCE